ncbi:hypothetical protein [Streptomyces alkaliterrae]|uniref:DUF3325 family protein n=1 Tax=Streptomyces alkaliterrae TaxID=2213162 RepID=A0A5P0YNL6_9ACTN|nr:hypothetical protein [Streptomyces alkaliterrae]MBB1253641.1 hypothetical protein [Streptomyces alkaliterrae]MBB1259765.1 hypothetical protein [Streptomyces alkaliterrae]MQS01861.1 hypothetical protein [Streptomyces alkaliterrae]
MTVVVFAVGTMFLALAVGARAGRRRDGLTPFQRWISDHRTTCCAAYGALLGTLAATTTGNVWYLFAGAGAAAATWRVVPWAAARLRRRHG